MQGASETVLVPVVVQLLSQMVVKYFEAKFGFSVYSQYMNAKFWGLYLKLWPHQRYFNIWMYRPFYICHTTCWKLLPCHLITWALREEQIWDLTSSQLCCQWQLCSGLCCCFIGWAVPFTSSDVGRCDPVKHWWILTQHHAITFQKTWILRSRFIEHGSEVNWVCLLTSRLYSSMDLTVRCCVLRMP